MNNDSEFANISLEWRDFYIDTVESILYKKITLNKVCLVLLGANADEKTSTYQLNFALTDSVGLSLSRMIIEIDML